jgi:hypothetical protein
MALIDEKPSSGDQTRFSGGSAAMITDPSMTDASSVARRMY